MTLPAFGLGTFRLKDQTVIDSVRSALNVGYRAIDTAQIYENEAQVGQAIVESEVPRGDLFLTTRIWTDNLSKDKLIPSLQDSLKKLRTDHVDLTLIHWPSPVGAVPLAESLQALLEAKAQEMTRQIGVSNFSPSRCSGTSIRSTSWMEPRACGRATSPWIFSRLLGCWNEDAAWNCVIFDAS